MNKGLKIFLVFIIAIVLGLLVFLTFYKFNIYDNKEKSNGKLIDVGSVQNYTYDVNYKEVYSEYIVNDIKSTTEYFVVNGNSAIYGNVYIGSDRKLYITDDVNSKVSVLIEEDIKSIYAKNITDSLMVYALAVSGKLYSVELYKCDISESKVNEIEFSSKVISFTTLNINSYDGFDNVNSVVVLLANGKMYDAVTKVEYSEKILNVLDKYIVYEDNSLSDYNGRMLVDSSGNNYKVKSIIIPFSDTLSSEIDSLILTSTDRLIYLKSNGVVYDFGKKVSDVTMGDNNECVITFEDNDSLKFKGSVNLDYYPIK